MYTYVIIDDERLIRLGLISRVREITAEEFECVGEAANGAQGLDVIEKTKPDIVITDMKMARMDGVEFLKRLHEHWPGTPVIVISGYKAFDYMSQAIEYGVVGYVLKPFSTEEIEKQLLKAVAKLEQQRSIARMKEKVVSFEKQTEGIEFLKLILEPWSVENEGGGNFLANYWHILLSVYTNEPEAMNLFRECGARNFQDTQYLCLENPGSKGQYFLLFTTEEEKGISRITEQISGFLDSMKRIGRERKFFAAVGNAFHGLREVNRSFQKNEKILRDIYLTDRVRIFYEDRYVKNHRRIYSEEELQDILVGIKYSPGQEQGIMQKFFSGFSVEKDSLLEIGTACKKLLGRVDEWAVQNQVDTDDIMSVFYRRYRFQEDLDKMEKEVSGYVSLISLSIRRKSYGDDYIYEQMTKYIQENYYKKITLQTLASQFYVSAAQCSSLLKERMEKGLNTYLLEIRIEKAKELLDGTNMSAEQISREVGYPNPKYFFRMFKQATTFTPIEYRNRRK